ncbi:MAG: D-alanine--D-alanine ligase [Actinomycetia bacterium]|nr:D-alanine--D-alanine ligase [Actinomycetes bacterium]
MRVAVLMGGNSAEREVSLETGKAIAGALRELGHQVLEVDAGTDLPLQLSAGKPDVAFLALHGRGGEDGCVQGLLEVMRIPYTGCGVLASAVTMDKVVTKELLSYHGVPVAGGVVASRGSDLDAVADTVAGELSYPVMVKPASEGSSIAVTEVGEPSGLRDALELVFDCDERALVERYVHGRLLTVGILGNEPRVLPVLEIKPREGFYDYRAKYEPGFTEYEVPAAISPQLAEAARDMSLTSFQVLGCEGISRVDIMLEHGTDELVVLEINTIPGMTETSLIPKAATAAGMSFEEVVAEVLEGARLKVSLAGDD